MPRKFVLNGNTISVVNYDEATSLDSLPPKIYTVQYNEAFGYFYLLTGNDQFHVPKKIYGNVMERVNKCVATYTDRDASMGILMTGDKGTGKSLLLSILSNTAIKELGLPVIIIKDSFSGEKFTTFIESIGECCLVFDEFGKLYTTSQSHPDGVSQNSLLSLIDGVDKTKRLVIMTENKEYDISEFLLNRPSRVYYHFRYTKLDEPSTIGYCEDHNISSNDIADIITLSRRSRIFSFDMLQTIVEEIIRTGTSVEEGVGDLNIDVSANGKEMILITKVIDKNTNTEREIDGSTIKSKPTGNYNGIYISIKNKTPKKSTNVSSSSRDEYDVIVEDDDSEVYIQESDLKYEHGSKIVYDTHEYTVVAENLPVGEFDYSKVI